METPEATARQPKSGRYVYHWALPLLLLGLIGVLVAQRWVMRRTWLGPKETMQAQLTALQRADFAEAFTFAADGLRERMELAQFRSMIEAAFPEFVRSKTIKLEGSVVEAQRAYFDVAVTGADGAVLKVRYHLVLEAGWWRVMAVEPRLPLPDRARRNRVTT